MIESFWRDFYTDTSVHTFIFKNNQITLFPYFSFHKQNKDGNPKQLLIFTCAAEN